MTFWATENMNRTAAMKQDQRSRDSAIAQARRDKIDDEHTREWLGWHSPKTKPKPKPKPRPLERWQMRVRVQKQERRALAKPLLKGVK
jgi:transcription initiation factor TFIIIB Brf1 subunit/transcription initiation factor TFIIB